MRLKFWRLAFLKDHDLIARDKLRFSPGLVNVLLSLRFGDVDLSHVFLTGLHLGSPLQHCHGV